MVIAIGIAAAFMVYMSNRHATRRTGRIDKLGQLRAQSAL